MLNIRKTRIVAAAIVAVAAVTQAQHAEKDIVETAAAAGSFGTLAKALQAADLVSTLKGPGPFTVFAPTDEAFAKLPQSTLNDCDAPSGYEVAT